MRIADREENANERRRNFIAYIDFIILFHAHKILEHRRHIACRKSEALNFYESLRSYCGVDSMRFFFFARLENGGAALRHHTHNYLSIVITSLHSKVKRKNK